MSKTAMLGAFVFTALVLFFVAIFLIGDRQFSFSRTYRLHALFAQVSGLENGAPVRIGGVRVGSVKEIRLPEKPGEQVRVSMELEDSTRKITKLDSVALIDTEGLLGNKFVSVTFGSVGSPTVREGDTITSQPPMELSDLTKKINGIADQTKDVLVSVNGIMHSAQGSVDNIDAITGNLKTVSQKINQGDGTLGALVNDKQVYQSLNSATVDIRETMSAARVGVVSFQENMEALKHNFLLRGYFKDRGYFDSAELAKYTIPELPAQAVTKKFVIEGKNLFDKETTAKFKKSKLLDPVGEFLEQTQVELVVIAAYSSEKGEADENVTLTQARAAVVREYLSNNFKLDDTKIKTKGMGEEPSGNTAQANRIEILIYSGKQALINK